MGIRRKRVSAAGVRVQIPRRAVSDIAVQHEGLVLSKHAHHVDTRIRAVGKREVNDAVFAAERHRRLRAPAGEHAQTAALATRQDHGYAFFSYTHELLLTLLAGAAHICDAYPPCHLTYLLFRLPLARLHRLEAEEHRRQRGKGDFRAIRLLPEGDALCADRPRIRHARSAEP